MRSNLQCLRSETGDMGRYLPRLRFFISDSNELTEPKFNTHKPKDLYNFIIKFLFQFFLAKTGCQKTAFFHFFKMSFRGLSIKKTKENGFRKSFKTIKNLFQKRQFSKKCSHHSLQGVPKIIPTHFKILQSVTINNNVSWFYLCMYTHLMLQEQDMRSNLQCLHSETGDMGYGTSVGSDFLSPALMNLQSPNSKQLHLRNYKI